MLKLVSIVDRNTLLTNNIRQKDDQKFNGPSLQRFLTSTDRSKGIISKHWKVLKNDCYLGPVLPDRTGVIYRGASSIQGSIAPNVVDPPMRTSFFYQLKGF